MKIFKSIQFFSLVLVLLSVEAKAQNDFRPGYIVTLQNDTVEGLVSYRRDIASAASCILKKKGQEEKVIYTADQIKSYGFSDGKCYTSSNFINSQFDQPVFVENVIQGPVNLFYYRDEAKSHFYISIDTTVVELDYRQSNAGTSGEGYQATPNPNKFKGQLKALMNDQPSLFPKIDRMVCNKNDLVSLLKAYMNLSRPEQEFLQLKEKTTKDITAKFGLFFSGGVSHLSSPPYNMYISDYEVTKYLDFDLAFTYEVGAMVNLHLNFIGENKFILQITPALNIVEYHSYTERFLYPLLYSYKANVKYAMLNIPVMFKYSLYRSDQTILPFFKFGVGSAIYLSQKGTYEHHSRLLKESQADNTGYTKSLNTADGRRLKNYFSAGVGVDVTVGKRLLSAGAMVEYGAAQFESFRLDGRIQIGFQF